MKKQQKERYKFIKKNVFQTQNLLQGTGSSGDSPPHRDGDRKRKNKIDIIKEQQKERYGFTKKNVF